MIFHKIPFLRLCIPLIAGIYAQYHYSLHKLSLFLILVSIVIIFASLVFKRFEHYQYRWVFGSGVSLFIFSIGVFTTLLQQVKSSMPLLDVYNVYQGTIIDEPIYNPNTVTLGLRLNNENRKIICYLPKDSSSVRLKFGETISFFSKLNEFNKVVGPNNFDYARYMYNQGYIGTTFVNSDWWEKVDKNVNFDILIQSLKCRNYILRFFKSLLLSNPQYAFISGIALGYRDDLPDELTHQFEVAGVSHILSVSGLHVTLLCSLVISLFSFIPRSPWFLKLKFTTVIVILWFYVFVIGLPPSAVRACIMLTLFLLSKLLGNRTNSYNNLFIAAFFLLLCEPFNLFDIGFLLSFLAVSSILYFFPFFNRRFHFKNTLVRYLWTLLSLSVCAQIGILPICVYYFGMFPTYFLFTNILIIPLVTFVIYDLVLICLVSIFVSLVPFLAPLIEFPIELLRLGLNLILTLINFFEELPYANLNKINISLFEVFVMLVIIVFLKCYLQNFKAKNLIITLTSTFILLASVLYDRHRNQNTLVVNNDRTKLDVNFQINYRKYYVSTEPINHLLYLNGKNYLILSNNEFSNKTSAVRFKINYLHLNSDSLISVYSLKQIFDIEQIIIGSCVSPKASKRFITECEKLRIPYYDVSNNGHLRINF